MQYGQNSHLFVWYIGDLITNKAQELQGNKQKRHAKTIEGVDGTTGRTCRLVKEREQGPTGSTPLLFTKLSRRPHNTTIRQCLVENRVPLLLWFHPFSYFLQRPKAYPVKQIWLIVNPGSRVNNVGVDLAIPFRSGWTKHWCLIFRGFIKPVIILLQFILVFQKDPDVMHSNKDPKTLGEKWARISNSLLHFFNHDRWKCIFF